MKTLFILFVACMAAGASLTGCANDSIGNISISNQPQVLLSIDSLVIRTSQTGTVNASNIAICVTQNVKPVTVSFTASINGTAQSENKYVQVSYSKDNQINFAFAKYNDAINGEHSFTISKFDNISFYIKILENYSPNAFIKLTNINVTK